MEKGINSAQGQKLGEMQVNISEPSVVNEVINLQAKIWMEEKEKTLKIPRYRPATGWIPTFGLPPFEFIGVPDLQETEKTFSDDTQYKEKIRVQEDKMQNLKILLDRSQGDKKEKYRIREFSVPSGRGVGLSEVNHTDGELMTVIERIIEDTGTGIKRAQKNLEKPFQGYMQRVRREEGLPSVLIFKRAEIKGTRPPIYSELFPYWSKQSYNNDEVKILELGYLEYGDNETEVDKIHGRWYKLYKFSDFDYDYLEIREGDWKSTEIEFKGEKRSTLDHYKRNIFKY